MVIGYWKKSVILTSVTTSSRRNLNKSVCLRFCKCKVMRTTSDKNSVKYARVKNATVAAGCTGECGRVGSQGKWEALSRRKLRHSTGWRMLQVFPLLQCSQVGSHLQRAGVCHVCPLVIQTPHLSSWWFTHPPWTGMWWEFIIGGLWRYVGRLPMGTALFFTVIKV